MRKIQALEKEYYVKEAQTMNSKRIAQALNEFSPTVMTRYLKRAQDGTVYFDRSALVIDKDSGAKFYYMLNAYYIAGWKDIEHLTPYFEMDGNTIIAGGYNIVTGKKTSKRRLISTNHTTPYCCSERDIERYKEIITATQNAPQRAK